MAKFDPNSPNRPEFGFFEQLLGRKIAIPDTAAEAHTQIEVLLDEAYKSKPYDLVRMSGANRLRSLWNSFGNDRSIIKESMDFVVTRLWERGEDGIPGKARNAEIGSSTNAIKYYRAKDHGLIPYLGTHIGWIISDYLKVLYERNKTVSLDDLEANGVSLASDMRFVREHMSVGVGEEDPHTNAAQRLGGKSPERSAALNTHLAAEIEDRDGLAVELPDSVVAAPEKIRAAVEPKGVSFEESIAHRPKYRATSEAGKLALRGTARPDLEIFEGELNRQILLAPDPETREHQLRSLATETIRSRCQGMPEMEEMIEAVGDWRPFEKSFPAFFPEVVDWINDRARQEREALKGRSLSTDESKPLPPVELFAAMTENDILATEHDPEAQADVAQTLIQQSRLWRTHATPEMLSSAERPDYAFLRHRLGYGHPPIEDGPKRKEDLRGLAAEFVTGFFASAPFLKGRFLESLREWDPDKSLFTEEISRTVAKMVERDNLPLTEVTNAAGSFFSLYRAEHEVSAPTKKPRRSKSPDAQTPVASTAAVELELPGL